MKKPQPIEKVILVYCMITLANVGGLILILYNETTSTALQVRVLGLMKPNFSQELHFGDWVPSGLDRKKNLFTEVLNHSNDRFI